MSQTELGVSREKTNYFAIMSFCLSCIALINLSACSSDDDIVLREVKQQNSKAGPLREVSFNGEFLGFIRNGILAKALTVSQVELDDQFRHQAHPNKLRINGRDDADLTLSDESRIYRLSQDNPTPGMLKVRAYSISEQPPLVDEVGSYSLNDGNDMDIHAAYLLEAPSKQIIAVRSGIGGEVNPGANRYKTAIHFIDESSINTENTHQSIYLDGVIVDRKRVGDYLYMVTRHAQAIDGLIYLPESDEDKLSNQQIIDRLSWSDLSPKYSINGGNSQLLHQQTECYLPAETKQNEGYPAIISFISINLVTQQLTTSCLGGQYDDIFISDSGVYVFVEEGESTAIHKIMQSEAEPNYLDTAMLSGSVMSPNPSFWVDENEGEFYVFSTALLANTDGAATRGRVMTVFSSPMQVGERFQLLGEEIIEDNIPEVGIPEMQTDRVRYLGNRAYLATPYSDAPLSVIDLSNSAQPTLTGFLTAKGNLDLLIPLDSDHFLGVWSATENFLTKVKLEVFNFSDAATPISVSSYELPYGSLSNVKQDPNNITVKRMSDGTYRVALPAYFLLSGPRRDAQVLETGVNYALHLFTISLDQRPSLSKTGEIRFDVQTQVPRRDRTVIGTSSLFYISDNVTLAKEWDEVAGLRDE